MRNGLTSVCRFLVKFVYALYLCLLSRRMNIQSFFQNTVNAFNSLGRSRKIILFLLILLGLLYYLGPWIFNRQNRDFEPEDVHDECLNAKISQYQQRIDDFDVFVSKSKPGEEPNGPAYVGNGKIAAALGTENGLFIRKHRALSQPVMFWPFVQTHLEGKVKEATMLDVRYGLAYRMQALSSASGCINIGSQVYAHRSRPSLLVQDIRIQNPTASALQVELDQIGQSGWKGVQIKAGSAKDEAKKQINYKIYYGTVPIDGTDKVIAISIATVILGETSVKVGPQSSQTYHLVSSIHYTKPLDAAGAPTYLPDLMLQSEGDLQSALKFNEKTLRQEHIQVWTDLWFSGFGISHSKATGVVNGDRINKTIYFVLSNAPAPLHDVTSTKEAKGKIEEVLYYPDRCYEGHSTLVSQTLWVNPEDEPRVARLVTGWMITLEKQGCMVMVQSGAEGILQAMVLSLGPLHFHNQHLELTSHPSDLHRDLYFRRVNYGNNTHVNISVIVGEDNKAVIWVALDRNDKPYYGCDAGCLDPPIQLSNQKHQFPVKLTDPVTSVLYITADKQHMEELKHAIHVKEINEAPPHEHHVIALHKHGHHFGGLPTIFWVSIAFLILTFHLFLFKLIYNEYCQGEIRYPRRGYNL